MPTGYVSVGNGISATFYKSSGNLKIVTKDRWDPIVVPLGPILCHAKITERDMKKMLAPWLGEIARQEALGLRRHREAIATSLRKHIKERDQHRCAYCGEQGSSQHGADGRRWHIDHVHPVSLGGLDTEDNLVLACATCNLSKGARPASTFQPTGRVLTYDIKALADLWRVPMVDVRATVARSEFPAPDENGEWRATDLYE